MLVQGSSGPSDAAVITAVDNEISELVRAAEAERADALGEILDQADAFAEHFLVLLNARSGTHPATALLLEAAARIGLLAVQHAKALHPRRRPSQVCPALKPPIAIPGHSSYPSGHATQAWLMQLCLRDAIQGTGTAKAGLVIEAQAMRIGRVREIAGLHYPSDSAAGHDLAVALHAALSEQHCPTSAPEPVLPRYAAALHAAKLEWA